MGTMGTMGTGRHDSCILTVQGLNLAMRLSQMPWRTRPQAKGIQGEKDASVESLMVLQS